jgi:hypothetical protein
MSEHDCELVCCSCAAPFIFTMGEQVHYADLSRQWGPPKLCPVCRLKANQAARKFAPTQHQCESCQDLFVLTAADRAHFKKKGWELPVTCGTCRHRVARERRAVTMNRLEDGRGPRPTPSRP